MLSSLLKSKHTLRATAVEYGLIAAGVAVAIIAVLNGINQRSHDNSSNPPAVQQQSK